MNDKKERGEHMSGYTLQAVYLLRQLADLEQIGAAGATLCKGAALQLCTTSKNYKNTKNP